MTEHITLRDAELKWFLTLLAKNKELTGFQSEMGEALVNGGDLNQISGRHGVLRSEAAAITSAIDAIRRRRPMVILAEFKAQAAELRRQAKDKLEERQRLLRETEKHLRALSQIEDVLFCRGILSAQRVGAWPGSPDARYEIDDLTPLEVGLDPSNGEPFKLPRSRRLLNEVIRLEEAAQELERREVVSAGNCHDVDSVEALISSIYSDPLRMGPAPSSIVAWADSCDDEFLKARGGVAIEARRIRFQWSNGEVDRSHSAIEYKTKPREMAAA